MLNKFIDNLKQKLPSSAGKKSAEEDDDIKHSTHSEEEGEESHDTSNNSVEISAEDKKKKQRSMIIRVIVVIALGYMAITEFVLKNDNQNNEVPTVAVKPRKPRKKPMPVMAEKKVEEKKVEEVKKPEEKIADAPIPPPSEAPVIAPVETKTEDVVVKKEEAPPIENVNITENKVDETSGPKVGEVKAEENKVDQSIDKLIDKVDETSKVTNDKENIPKKKEVKLEDKIVVDDVYTPPPAYDQLGRGLVYNCKERYWACVDKAAYVACNKNMRWNTGKGKSSECVVQNVYNTDEDCGIIQKYNVSTSKETSFCK